MACGCCRSRNILMFILVLQMLLVVERQVFDFLGFMWAPIIANFLQIALLVVGIFGVHQYRPGCVIAYSVWCLVWFGINLTIISLYLEIGMLSYYVESIQCGVECILAFTGFWLACWVARTFAEEDDRFDFIGGFDSYSAYQPPTKSSRIQMQPISS